MANKKSISKNQHENVVCNLDFKRLQDEILNLEELEFNQFTKTITKIEMMSWDQIYKTSSKSQKRGLSWEIIENQITKSGKKTASIRISKKFRARVCRDQNYMIFISLHPDHDSAYDENGGEGL